MKLLPVKGKVYLKECRIWYLDNAPADILCGILCLPESTGHTYEEGEILLFSKKKASQIEIDKERYYIIDEQYVLGILVE